MKNSQKGFVILIIIIVVLSVIGGGYFYYKSNKVKITSNEMMDVTLYIQDKSYVATSSCSVTKKVTYKIPKTIAVADASLKILFSEELSAYGVYQSVTIVDGVAKVKLASDIVSLSGCESSHLLSVLEDTLTQYNSIKSVELSSPKGIIQF